MDNSLKTQRLDELYKQKVVDEFARLYYDDPDTWPNTSWMGVLTQKYPTDLIMYAEIIYKTRPDLIIECGTALGGSALYLAHILDIVHGDYGGQVISIDAHEPGFYKKPRHLKVAFWEGKSSTSSEVLDSLNRIIFPRHRVMVILDSDHSKAHVLSELELYHQFVTPGCYLIVEDTNLNSVQARPDHGPGPKEALEEWLPNHPEFEIDPYCTRFILTAHPGGYLIRK